MSGIKRLRVFTTRIIAVANIVAVVAMCVMGYAGTLSPERHPSYEMLSLLFPFALLLNLLFLVFWLIVRLRYMLISVVGLVACLPPVRSYCPVNIPKDAPEGCIRVMTYNVCYFSLDRQVVKKPGKLAEYIVGENADIVCLQEYYTNKKDSLRRQYLSSVYPYFEKISEGKKEIVAVFSKYPIVSKERIQMDKSHNMSGAFYLDVDGDTLLVINSHLESMKLTENEKTEIDDFVERKRNQLDEQTIISKLKNSSAKRAKQAEIVADYVNVHKNMPIIFCGDINDTPVSYPHHVLTRHLSDCFTATGNGPGFSLRSKGIFVRIDNILCSNDLEPFACKIDTKVELSDHYPMICSLKKRQKSKN